MLWDVPSQVLYVKYNKMQDYYIKRLSVRKIKTPQDSSDNSIMTPDRYPVLYF